MAEIVTLIFSLLTTVLVTVVVTFYKEKAKNIATKEDIGKITDSVESIKSNYATEQEKLKAKLNLIVTAQNSLHGDTKRAIYDFWEGAVQVVTLCDTTRNEIDEERVNELGYYRRNIEKVANEFQLRHARLYFLVTDRPLLDLAQTIYNSISKVQGKFELFLVRTEPHLIEMSRLYNAAIFSKERYNAEWKKVQEWENKFDEETEEFQNSLDTTMEEFKQRALLLLQAAPKIN
jgi:hypothetical protein